MSFDQGAWDAITGLGNQRSQDAIRIAHALEQRDEQIAVLEKRLAELEQRFRDLKKAVWRA